MWKHRRWMPRMSNKPSELWSWISTGTGRRVWMRWKTNRTARSHCPILVLIHLVLVHPTRQRRTLIHAVEVFLNKSSFVSLFLHLAVTCTVCTFGFSLSLTEFSKNKEEAPEQMTCLHEDSLVCRDEKHWLWILFTLLLLLICLLYLLSRPNYVRLSSNAHELISPAKQQMGTNNQRLSYTDKSPLRPTNASCSIDIPQYWSRTLESWRRNVILWYSPMLSHFRQPIREQTLIMCRTREWRLLLTSHHHRFFHDLDVSLMGIFSTITRYAWYCLMLQLVTHERTPSSTYKNEHHYRLSYFYFDISKWRRPLELEWEIALSFNIDE